MLKHFTEIFRWLIAAANVYEWVQAGVLLQNVTPKMAINIDIM